MPLRVASYAPKGRNSVADPEGRHLAERRLEETEMVAYSGKGEEETALDLLDPMERDWEAGKEWPPAFPGDG